MKPLQRPNFPSGSSFLCNAPMPEAKVRHQNLLPQEEKDSAEMQRFVAGVS